MPFHRSTPSPNPPPQPRKPSQIPSFLPIPSRVVLHKCPHLVSQSRALSQSQSLNTPLAASAPSGPFGNISPGLPQTLLQRPSSTPPSPFPKLQEPPALATLLLSLSLTQNIHALLTTSRRIESLASRSFSREMSEAQVAQEMRTLEDRYSNLREAVKNELEAAWVGIGWLSAGEEGVKDEESGSDNEDEDGDVKMEDEKPQRRAISQTLSRAGTSNARPEKGGKRMLEQLASRSGTLGLSKDGYAKSHTLPSYPYTQVHPNKKSKHHPTPSSSLSLFHSQSQIQSHNPPTPLFQTHPKSILKPTKPPLHRAPNSDSDFLAQYGERGGVFELPADPIGVPMACRPLDREGKLRLYSWSWGRGLRGIGIGIGGKGKDRGMGMDGGREGESPMGGSWGGERVWV